jgi:hypothetical protein
LLQLIGLELKLLDQQVLAGKLLLLLLLHLQLRLQVLITRGQLRLQVLITRGQLRLGLGLSNALPGGGGSSKSAKAVKRSSTFCWVSRLLPMYCSIASIFCSIPTVYHGSLRNSARSMT